MRIAVKKHGKTRYQTFVFLSSFTGLHNFVPNILSGIVLPFLVLGVRQGRKMIHSFLKQIKRTTKERKIRSRFSKVK